MRDLDPIFRKSTGLGISVEWCDPAGMLSNGVEGFEKYLKLWPDGPRVDEAWWQARVMGPRCGDFEGTQEEYEDTVKRYSTFIERFPHSQHTPEARERVSEAKRDLKALAKKPEH